MKLNIDKPCSENWETMKIGMISRHCDVCEKNVYDFTNKSKTEILTFLLQNQGQSTCGRLKKSQLDFHHDELEVIIEGLKNQKNNKYAFAALSLACLMLVSCGEEETRLPHKETQRITTEKEQIVVEHILDSTIATQPILKEDTVKHKKCASTKNNHIDSIDDELIIYEIDDIILGDVSVSYMPDSAGSIYTLVEKMPEFVGGIDSLFSYLKANIVYPEREKKNDIQGTVYVNFIVETDGSIAEIKIIRGLSENCDNEVIRVMELMPNWIPGENSDGEKVSVYYNLPINFKLKD